MLQLKIVGLVWKEIASKKDSFFYFLGGEKIKFSELSKNDTKGVLRPLEQF